MIVKSLINIINYCQVQTLIFQKIKCKRDFTLKTMMNYVILMISVYPKSVGRDNCIKVNLAHGINMKQPQSSCPHSVSS